MIKYVVLATIIAFSIITMPRYLTRENSDFDYYYQAGLGNLDHEGGKYSVPYIYHPITQIAFKPLVVFDHYTAKTLFYIMGVICWMLLVWLLMGVKYGWVVAILSFYPYWLNLQCGNINTVLALLGCHQTTGVLAAAFKPYYTLHTAIAHYRAYRKMPHAFVWSGGVIAMCVVLYFTNQNLQEFSVHWTEEFTRKMNLIHLLPLYYLWMINEKTTYPLPVS